MEINVLDLNNNKKIVSVLDEICLLIKKRKKLYFSAIKRTGWQPLKPDTIKRKLKKYPNNAYKFNTASGTLRDSLNVFWKIKNKNTIEIFIEFQHENGDEVIKYLTETLGRDFITITDEEIKSIKNILEKAYSKK